MIKTSAQNDNEAAIAALAEDQLASRRALDKWQQGLEPDFGKPVLTTTNN
jgi:hypothetical protein